MNTSIRNDSVTAVIGNNVLSANSTHPNWVKIMEAVKNDDATAFVNAMNIRQSVINYVNGKIKIIGNEVFYDKLRIGGVIVDRLLNFIGEGLPATPIVRFIENLYSNPSQRAVTELYSFLEHKNLPVTAAGNFLAYKGLKADFYSITNGKLTLIQGMSDSNGYIFNGVGETVECVRNQVDDNKENHCSTGIHAGSLEYATNFAGQNGVVVIVEINPKDVVSIPSDCDCQKLRTCKYTVVGRYEGALDSTYNTQYSSDDDLNEFGSVDDTDLDTEFDADFDDELNESDYTAGYNVGRLDSQCHCKSNISHFTDSYQTGYKHGYGHKAKLKFGNYGI